MVLNQQITIGQDDRRYPASLARLLGNTAPKRFWAAGPLDILDTEKTAFFCSAQCPGSVVLKTFDAITDMRDKGRTIIGGFRSPMEQECLKILLRGQQPIIWVPARSIQEMHLKPELQQAFSAGRLLLLSPFENNQKRITTALAQRRNQFVAAIADRIFIAYAAPTSNTLALCRTLQEQGRPLVTLDDLK